MKKPDYADVIIEISLEDARELPNLLGRITPVMLKAHGFYAVTVGDKKTLFVLKVNQ